MSASGLTSYSYFMVCESMCLSVSSAETSFSPGLYVYWQHYLKSYRWNLMALSKNVHKRKKNTCLDLTALPSLSHKGRLVLAGYIANEM